MAPLLLTRRRALHSGLALAAALPAAWQLAACDPPPAEGDKPIEPGSLEWAAAGDWRLDPERDAFRHPVETLRFWGVEPGMTVLELLPGVGWMTAILAPYLKRGGGKLIAASFDPEIASPARLETLAAFDARFNQDMDRFGEIERRVIGPAPRLLAAPGSVDVAILANNMHTLMAEQSAERVFRLVFDALKPDGVFGVEQHRAASTGLQDPLAGSGYVQEAYVKTLAHEAGFQFVAASDINANPKDDRDHPFGVWTLPPVLRSSPLGQPDDPSFDSRPYREIGESDRMTLKFRKPGAPLPPPQLREGDKDERR